MKTTGKQRSFWMFAPLAVGFIAPSVILFCLEVIVGRIRPSAAIADILQRQFAEGHNLFLLAMVGLIPFVALAVACFVLSYRVCPVRLACVASGGLLGILFLMIPAHVAVWYPLYGGGHASSTAVLAFLFIPFYCLVPLAIGLAAGWVVSLLPYFRGAAS